MVWLLCRLALQIPRPGSQRYNIVDFKVPGLISHVYVFSFFVSIWKPSWIIHLNFFMCIVYSYRLSVYTHLQILFGFCQWNTVLVMCFLQYIEDNLSVMSIGFLLSSPDDAIIWRGPKKNGTFGFLMYEVWSENVCTDYSVILP